MFFYAVNISITSGKIKWLLLLLLQEMAFDNIFFRNFRIFYCKVVEITLFHILKKISTFIFQALFISNITTITRFSSLFLASEPFQISVLFDCVSVKSAPTL